MGTSQSSPGSPSGKPLVPPWVGDPLPTGDDDGSQEGGQVGNGQGQTAPVSPDLQVAPIGRFRAARASLARFAISGLGTHMRRGLGHYIHKGLGGGSSAVRRFSGTARTAGSLFGALSSVAAGLPSRPGSPLDPSLLFGKSAQEIIDAVVEAVRPTDGTLDAESSQYAISCALSELLERFPGADLLNLSEDQRFFAIERYVARDVYNHIELDIGRTVQDKSPSALVALTRMRQIRDYVRETIAACLRALRNAGETLTVRRIVQMGAQALRDAFAVFEGYVQ